MMTFDDASLDHAFLQTHTTLLLDSYRDRVGKELIGRTGDPEADARTLFEAPFAVASAGTEEDPVLNYGNARALELWAMDWATFTRTPAKQTAEPDEREARERLLQLVREQGYIDDYQGTRITSTGQRFQIERATIWNVTGVEGKYRGQAAALQEWHLLE